MSFCKVDRKETKFEITKLKNTKLLNTVLKSISTVVSCELKFSKLFFSFAIYIGAFIFKFHAETTTTINPNKISKERISSSSTTCWKISFEFYVNPGLKD